MNAVEILALALGASAVLAAVCALGARAAERISDDPQWRDRLWSAAFWIPVAAALLTALFLLLPPAETAPTAIPSAAFAPIADQAAAQSAPTAAKPAPLPLSLPIWIDWTSAAVVMLALAGLASLWRLGGLVWRVRRLSAVIRSSHPASPELAAVLATRGGRLPALRVSRHTNEAFLAGPWRPVLVLPESLTYGEAGPIEAIFDHELAHLRRRDLAAMWLEEAALVLLAGNPLLPMLQARRGLAREEACDDLALTGASASARRLYAKALVDALRSRAQAPAVAGLALTFTGNQGESAMRRIKAILEPRPSAGRLTRRLSLAAITLVGGAVCAGSLALAAQREGDGPLIVDLDSGQIGATRQWDLISAAVRPVLETGWPGSCGLSMDERDQLFVHRSRCDGSDAPDPQLLTLQGIDPVAHPQAAFDAVAAACIAGTPINITEKLETGVTSRTASCGRQAQTPTPMRLLRMSFAYDGVTVAPGDRLHITLSKPDGGELELNHVIGLPATAPDAIQSRAAEDYLQLGATPRLSVNLISKEGVVKAVSRPATRPLTVEGDAVRAEVVMTPGTAPDDTLIESWRQTQVLRAEGLSDQEAWEATLNPRYRRVSAAQFQGYCGGTDATDAAYCKAILVEALAAPPEGRRTVCAPTDTGGGLYRAIETRGLSTVAATRPRSDEGAHEYARRTMAQAFPCGPAGAGGRASRDDVVVWMPVTIEGAVGQGEMVRVALIDARGAVLAETVAVNARGGAPEGVRIPLTGAEFPRLGQGNRVYTLAGEIRGADGAVKRTAETATVRLAPGSQRAARNMTATLSFGG